MLGRAIYHQKRLRIWGVQDLEVRREDGKKPMECRAFKKNFMFSFYLKKRLGRPTCDLIFKKRCGRNVCKFRKTAWPPRLMKAVYQSY